MALLFLRDLKMPQLVYGLAMQSLVIFLTTRKETATLLITDLAVFSDADVLSRSIAIVKTRAFTSREVELRL